MKTSKTSLIGELLESISPNEKKKVETKMLLSARIEDAMRAKGWKKKDLMQAMGKTNQSEVTRWLSGTHNFSSDTLTDLGLALGVNFFNIDEPELPSIVFHVQQTVFLPNVEQTNFITSREENEKLGESIALSYNCN